MIDKISSMLGMNKGRRYAVVRIDANGKRKVVHLTENEINKLNDNEGATDKLFKKLSELWNNLFRNKGN